MYVLNHLHEGIFISIAHKFSPSKMQGEVQYINENILQYVLKLDV